ncbi:glycoside hydrolase superfamily [Mycena polygramma]|nr:glycoside hydrolase superfamily [Mycena polygramma]
MDDSKQPLLPQTDCEQSRGSVHGNSKGHTDSSHKHAIKKFRHVFPVLAGGFLLALIIRGLYSPTSTSPHAFDRNPNGDNNTQPNPNDGSNPADLPDNVGRLPFMGYNTWNAYHCDINETVISDSARLMVELGFKDSGYTYMNIDDCYAEKNRTDNGTGVIVESKDRFPSGMRNLTDYIHSLGMRAGIYSDSGWFTCQLFPGSYTNEEKDVRTFQGDWNFDLLKYDNCAVPFDEVIKLGMVGKFSLMANAVVNVAKALGRTPMLFSLCQWGREQPWIWARDYGQTWRTTDDIGPQWNAISSIINQVSFYSWAADFYGHNDLDIMEVGNGGMTFEEEKSHFTAWAFLKSPLLIGTDLTQITNETIEILSNREIIAINQDPVYGKAVTPFRWGKNPDWTNDPDFPAQYWSMQSENGTVVMALNVLNETADLFFTLAESPWLKAGRSYNVRDLWSHTDNGTVYRNITLSAVPPHGVVAMLLTDAGDEPAGTQPPCSIIEWCTDQNGTIVDGVHGPNAPNFSPLSSGITREKEGSAAASGDGLPRVVKRRKERMNV